MEGHSARVRVPRGRAQDGVCVREWRSARNRGGAEVFDISSPVRNELPDDGDDHLDGRVYDDSCAYFLGSIRHPDCVAAADCGRFLRDHPLRRQASWLAVRADDSARTVAAANYDPASG